MKHPNKNEIQIIKQETFVWKSGREGERETKRARIIRCILMGFVNQKATEVSEHGELGFFLDRTDWDEEDEDNVT